MSLYSICWLRTSVAENVLEGYMKTSSWENFDEWYQKKPLYSLVYILFLFTFILSKFGCNVQDLLFFHIKCGSRTPFQVRPDAPSLSEPCWRCAFPSSVSGWVVSNHVSTHVSGPISWLDSLGGLWTQSSVSIYLGQPGQLVTCTLLCPQLSGVVLLCSDWRVGITHSFHLIFPPMWMGPTHWHLSSN